MERTGSNYLSKLPGWGAFLLAEQHGSRGRDGAENRAGGAQTDPRWVCAGAETRTGAQSVVGGVVFLLGAVKPLQGCGGRQSGVHVAVGRRHLSGEASFVAITAS